MSTSDDTTLKATQMAYEDALLADLLEYAGADSTPRFRLAITDLWAHLRDIRDDGRMAARMVRTILDLGWRP